VLRSTLVHNQPFHSEDFLNPLCHVSPVKAASHFTYVVHFAPLLGIRLCAGHSSKVGEEPLRHGVNGVDCRDLAPLRPARGNVEAQEVLHGGKIRSFDSGPQATSSGRFFVRNGQSCEMVSACISARCHLEGVSDCSRPCTMKESISHRP
jgi:hypothetical protein